MKNQNTKAPQPPKGGATNSLVAKNSLLGDLGAKDQTNVISWRAKLLWLPAIFYMAFIFYLSSGPITVNINPFDLPYIDKILHFLAYGLLAILLYLPIRFNIKRNYKKITLLLVLLYGISDEIHQYFTPTRQFDLLDLLADILGGIVGIIFIELIFVFYYLTKNKVK